MKKHYDICVAGFWYGSNYGSLLNGYAEYRILKDMGKEVLMLQKPGTDGGDLEIIEGYNTRFVNRYYDQEDISPILSYSRLGELNEICDCFCAGSDQIWNYNLSFHENMYLPFVHDDRKLISFATSFGHKKDKVPDKARSTVKKYLQRYHAISVREEFDVEILKENYGVIGTLVFEPVFCIDKHYYDDLIENAQFAEPEPYLLTYILDPTPEKREAILYYAEKTGLKLVNILNGVPSVWKRNKDLLNLPNTIADVGAEEFLKAFKNASYVITDSFHGSAFSIIFNKPFLAIGNYGRGYERFVDLLGRLGLMDRLISNPKNIPLDEKYLTAINYTEVNRIISEEAKRTVSWLKYALDTPKQELPALIIPENVITSKIAKTMCTGCGACVSVCPYNAIVLKADSMGYYRSYIDYQKCVNCGMCSKVCPAYKLPENGNEKKPACFAFMAADDDVLYASSSGGAFPTLAGEAFAREGIVVGAAWKDDFSVEHIIISDINELHKLQKSKYLQSYLGDIFRRIKEKLEKGIFVLFSGCPCQVAGLKAYLKREYDNLLLVDLLCGNSPSTLFFQKYIEDSFPEGLKKYEFRYKEQGWNWDCMTMTMTNGTSVVRRGGREDDYQRVYHNHTMCGPHCENCKYQETPRFGDLTIGDFWGIGNKDNTINTKKGVSVILCNNEKGRRYLDSIGKEKIGLKKEVPLNWLGGNGYAINGSHNYAGANRDVFYNVIGKMPFGQAVNYALKPNHGIYNKDENLSPLTYNSKALQFNFDKAIWEEHYIMGVTCLFVKMTKAPAGKYATLSLNTALMKGRSYVLIARFKIITESAYLNFHIKDSGSNYYQIIHTYKIEKNNSGWIEIRTSFEPNSDIYDEFMFGASQIIGNGSFLAIDYIYIVES